MAFETSVADASVRSAAMSGDRGRPVTCIWRSMVPEASSASAFVTRTSGIRSAIGPVSEIRKASPAGAPGARRPFAARSYRTDPQLEIFGDERIARVTQPCRACSHRGAVHGRIDHLEVNLGTGVLQRIEPAGQPGAAANRPVQRRDRRMLQISGESPKGHAVDHDIGRKRARLGTGDAGTAERIQLRRVSRQLEQTTDTLDLDPCRSHVESLIREAGELHEPVGLRHCKRSRAGQFEIEPRIDGERVVRRRER